jgi:hypothetical protein
VRAPLSVAHIGVYVCPRLSGPFTPGTAEYGLIATEIAEHLADDALTERQLENLRLSQRGSRTS